MGCQFPAIRLSSFLSIGKCLALFLAFIVGCFIGFGGFYLMVWQMADPGCHCLAERIILARRLIQRLWYLAVLIPGAGAVMLVGIVLWLKPMRSWRGPLTYSFLWAGFVGAVASFISLPPRYSYVPFQWIVPESMAAIVGIISNFVQSWLFLIVGLSWIVSYVVFKLACPRGRLVQLSKKR